MKPSYRRKDPNHALFAAPLKDAPFASLCWQECRFQFGLSPTAEDEAEARNSPCFGACPTLMRMRQSLPAPERCESMGGAGAEPGVPEWIRDLEAAASQAASEPQS